MSSTPGAKQIRMSERLRTRVYLEDVSLAYH
jgi:hypothetical protein